MRLWFPTFFACSLFFLCGADEVFATRAFGVNFRWGQLLLFVGALSLLLNSKDALKFRAPGLARYWPVFCGWGLFFLFYGISAAISDTVLPSAIKLAWGIFNISGAAIIGFLSPRPSTALRDGFVAACLLISGVIWVDAIAIYWFQATSPILGLTQTSYSVGDFLTLRPHGFYYEPSYAGAWLAIATPLMMLALSHRPRWVQALLPAISLSALFIVSARTGIVAVFMVLSLIVATAAVRRQSQLIKSVISVVAMSALLLSLFFLSKDARQYGLFILGPLGPSQTIDRLTMQAQTDSELTATRPAVTAKSVEKKKFVDSPASNTSEGARVASYIHAIELWKRHPWFGTGTFRGSKEDSLMTPLAMNTWLEVLSESGLFGFLAFIFAIGATVRGTLKGVDKMSMTVGASVWAVHLLVNLNLTQTFPRLDYWLLLFAMTHCAIQARTTLADSSSTNISEEPIASAELDAPLRHATREA